jgi:ATP-dependent Clp protease adaptor protein ClpS
LVRTERGGILKSVATQRALAVVRGGILVSVPVIVAGTQPQEKEEVKTRRMPPYHVILENDDHHSFEFVVEVLRKALAYTEEKAFLLTHEAHTKGRAVVWTGSKEVAELKAEQLQSFHEIRPDGAKLGPLGVVIEPAE